MAKYTQPASLEGWPSMRWFRLACETVHRNAGRRWAVDQSPLFYFGECYLMWFSRAASKWRARIGFFVPIDAHSFLAEQRAALATRAGGVVAALMSAVHHSIIGTSYRTGLAGFVKMHQRFLRTSNTGQ